MACCRSGGGIEGNMNESDEDDEYMGVNNLMYDRDIPGYNPRDLQYCKPLADLAIDFYNKKYSTQYRVVELIRVVGCVCSGYYFGMKFTAAEADADVETFGAEVHDGIEEITVESVDIVAEGVTLPVDVVPARYISFPSRRMQKQESVNILGNRNQN